MDARPTALILPILHQDEGRVAVHKPSGLHTHPSALSPAEDSVARWLSQQLQRAVHPVHRLDRGASGVLLFALSPAHARDLWESFHRRRVHKVYLALVRGWLPDDEGVVERPLKDMDPATRCPREQEAITRWRVLERVEAPFCGGRGAHAFPTTRVSLVECRPATGRMHQIRRHLNGLGHPLLGDGEHGDRHLNRVVQQEVGLHRLALVCTELRVPATQEATALHLGTALDPDLRRVLARLGMADPTATMEGPPLLDGVPTQPRRGWRQRRMRVEERERAALEGRVMTAAPAPPTPLQPWLEEGEAPPCPLCRNAARPFHSQGEKRWLSCAACGLVHGARHQWPTPEEAAARLARHRNEASDPGYVSWLAPFAMALAPRLPAGSRGLDAGCGPQPVLAGLLGESGFPTAHWDPLFAPHMPSPPNGGWDFITLCEVFEHLTDPLEELRRWREALRPGGWLLISTGLLRRDEAFPDWWYARDCTHLVMARPRTFEWLARELRLHLEWDGRLVLLRKRAEKHEGDDTWLSASGA